MQIMPQQEASTQREGALFCVNSIINDTFALTFLPDRGPVVIITLTNMSDSSADKRHTLEVSGTFNPRFADVRHELFQKSGFFDPQDLLQLKYETLRAVEKDGYSIARAANEFGLSRPTIYQAQEQLKTGGLGGLLPRKRGPRGGHKLTAELKSYLQTQAAVQPRPTAKDLSLRIQEHFKVKVHPRTLQKALKTQGQKRGRQNQR